MIVSANGYRLEHCLLRPLEGIDAVRTYAHATTIPNADGSFLTLSGVLKPRPRRFSNRTQAQCEQKCTSIGARPGTHCSFYVDDAPSHSAALRAHRHACNFFSVSYWGNSVQVNASSAATRPLFLTSTYPVRDRIRHATRDAQGELLSTRVSCDQSAAAFRLWVRPSTGGRGTPASPNTGGTPDWVVSPAPPLRSPPPRSSPQPPPPQPPPPQLPPPAAAGTDGAVVAPPQPGMADAAEHGGNAGSTSGPDVRGSPGMAEDTMGGSGGGNATWRTSLLARAVHVNSWPPAVRAVLARADVLPPEAWVSLTPPQLYVRAILASIRPMQLPLLLLLLLVCCLCCCRASRRRRRRGGGGSNTGMSGHGSGGGLASKLHNGGGMMRLASNDCYDVHITAEPRLHSSRDDFGAGFGFGGCGGRRGSSETPDMELIDMSDILVDEPELVGERGGCHEGRGGARSCRRSGVCGGGCGGSSCGCSFGLSGPPGQAYARASAHGGAAAHVCSYEELAEGHSDCSADDLEAMFDAPEKRRSRGRSTGGLHTVTGGLGLRNTNRGVPAVEKRSLLTDVDFLVS